MRIRPRFVEEPTLLQQLVVSWLSLDSITCVLVQFYFRFFFLLFLLFAMGGRGRPAPTYIVDIQDLMAQRNIRAEVRKSHV
jgi:hypothetical protein